MTALTFEEARERSRLLEVRGYRVDLDVTGGGEAFGSVTVVRFGCRAPGAGSFIELSPARLRRAVLNGREVDPATLTGNRLPLRGLRETNELRVEADMPYSRTGAGLHRFTDTADGETYLALHGGLDNAQRVFAAFDQPDLKAPVTAAVTAPGNWTVIGNGLARPAGDGRWELAATPPIATYLVTLVAGPYFSISTEHHGVPFGLHARQSLAGHLRRDAAGLLAVPGIGRASKRVDRASFEKLGVPVVDLLDQVIGLAAGEVQVVLAVHLADEALRLRRIALEVELHALQR